MSYCDAHRTSFYFLGKRKQRISYWIKGHPAGTELFCRDSWRREGSPGPTFFGKSLTENKEALISCRTFGLFWSHFSRTFFLRLILASWKALLAVTRGLKRPFDTALMAFPRSWSTSDLEITGRAPKLFPISSIFCLPTRSLDRRSLGRLGSSIRSSVRSFQGVSCYFPLPG